MKMLPTIRRGHILPPSSAKGFSSIKPVPAPEYPNEDKYEFPAPKGLVSSSAEVSDIAKTILGANMRRRYHMIQNMGPGVVYVGFGIVPDVTGNNAITLNAGFVLESQGDCGGVNEAYAVCPAGVVAIVNIVEGFLI